MEIRAVGVSTAEDIPAKRWLGAAPGSSDREGVILYPFRHKSRGQTQLYVGRVGGTFGKRVTDCGAHQPIDPLAPQSYDPVNIQPLYRLMTLQKPDIYGRYVNVTLTSAKTTIICSGLVDSGNEWRTVISPKIAEQLGYKEHQLGATPTVAVGTAKTGTALRVLGELPCLVEMQFKDVEGAPVVCFRPMVLAGLAVDLNISGTLLSQYKMDQLHSQGVLHYEGLDIPMHPAPEPSKHEAHTSRLYALESKLFPAHSIDGIKVGAKHQLSFLTHTNKYTSGSHQVDAKWGVSATDQVVFQKNGEPYGFTFVGRGFDVTAGVSLDKTLQQGLEKVAEQVVDACPTGALAHNEKFKPDQGRHLGADRTPTKET